jgi:glucokinase
MKRFLGIEIGGTKLQLGVGAGDGALTGLWRGTIDVSAGPDGIRKQITNAVPELLQRCGVERSQLHGVGIGFGGPVDDSTQTIIKSHQIEGWDGFPLADWVSDAVGLPAALGNDADVAGLAEALHGAGKGLSPIFYITIGSGIGGGLIIDGEIYRGCGRGAAEIGHLQFTAPGEEGEIGYRPRTLENVASGWAIEQRARRAASRHASRSSKLLQLVHGDPEKITARHVGQAACQGDDLAKAVLFPAKVCLADAICQVIALLCPRRVVLGGGVSLMPAEIFLDPLRRLVTEYVFKPFAGLTDIVPAALGEEVVVHGALALARKRFAG